MDSQTKRMIKEMKRRKVANHEFPKMYIMSYTRRIADIRGMGITVNKERLYDKDGKATGTYVYWIPRKRKVKDIDFKMNYEELPKSKFFQNAMRLFR